MEISVDIPPQRVAHLVHPTRVIDGSEQEQAVAGLPARRWATTMTFVCADALAFSLVGLAIYFVSFRLVPFAQQADYGLLLGLMPLMVGAYAMTGLYRAVLLHPAEELRRASLITAVVALSYVATVLLMEVPDPTVFAVGLAGGGAIVLVPACRALTRVCFARCPWWGMPALVLSRGAAGKAVVDTLRRWPELGLRPAALLQEKHNGREEALGLPVFTGFKSAPGLALRYGVPYAIVAVQGLGAREQAVLLDRYSRFFQRIFVVPDVSSVQAIWTTADCYEGLLGYGVQHYTWYTGTRLLKRAFDVIVALVLLLLLSPIMLGIMLLIRLDSDGPVLFSQERMGREGRCFRVLKFRTMHVDAEARLQELLSTHPELRDQYEIYHKLQDDPRVTRVGGWLRRYSLDELPQLWNVLRGEMSLVGPRAYLPAELPNMNGLSRVVLQSPPGVTGLWQVSGRNGLSFEERVDLDVHYTQNWTFWLDLYLLARTVPVVLVGEGAH